MTWTDVWDALQGNGAFPSVGAMLVIIGAIFRWFEPLCSFLARARILRVDPFAATREYVARFRAAGDERTARQAEERVQDHRRRLTRYGRAMMVVGVVIMALSVLTSGMR